MVDQSHSSGDTVAKILEISGEWRHKGSVLHKPPGKTNRTGLNPGTGVVTALRRHLHNFFAWSWTSRPRSYAQTAFIPEFRIPLLDTVENRCCLLEFCSKSSLHNGRGSCIFQNTK
jgi:hypothetical protein